MTKQSSPCSSILDLLVSLIDNLQNGELDDKSLLGKARLLLYTETFGPMPVRVLSEDADFFGLIDLKNEPDLMDIINKQCNKVSPKIIIIDVFDRERNRWFNLNYLEDSTFTTTADIDPSDPRLEKVFSMGVTTLDRLMSYFFSSSNSKEEKDHNELP